MSDNEQTEIGTKVTTRGGDALPADIRTGVDVNALMMAALKAGDPEAVTAAMEKLVELEERVAKREAERIFGEQLSKVRRAIPPIPRRNKGVERDGKIVMYADMDTIQEFVDPPLEDHGFFYRFTTDPSKDGQWLIITCKLHHEAGHSESSTMPVPMTSIPKASKAQEATGTRTYGKRITLSDVLGIATTDDLDGAGPGSGPAVNEDQVRTLRELVQKKQVDIDRVLEFAEVESLADVSAANYGMLVRFLESKKDPA